MKRRIVLWAGDVKSKDGDIHWINCGGLARLYRLDADLCTCIRSIPDVIGHRAKEGDIDLTPRHNGTYRDYSKEQNSLDFFEVSPVSTIYLNQSAARSRATQTAWWFMTGRKIGLPE